MTLENLRKEIIECRRCQLCLSCTQKVFGDIGDKTKVIFVGEAPGRDEDVSGKPFVGRAGKLLRGWIKESGLSDEEISILNICKCRPPENRTPTEVERQICGAWINKQLNYINCNKVVLLGKTACMHFLTEDKFDGKILSHIGEIHNINNIECLIFPHPSYVLRSGYEVPINKLKEFF
jgi:DNA polymerase